MHHGPTNHQIEANHAGRRGIEEEKEEEEESDPAIDGPHAGGAGRSRSARIAAASEHLGDWF